ncbi:MAG TPA: hypothetical protein VNI83_00100 [Vicinamibacterales bacterium]|nr:hypothetical protein [Vicinamibacterales bacterium]
MRRRGRQESRILYFFRTPPHVRVGRAALDEEAIRLLEQHHPGISFDWSRMLRARPPAPARNRAEPGPHAPPHEPPRATPLQAAPLSAPAPPVSDAAPEVGADEEEAGGPEVRGEEAPAQAVEPHPVVALLGVEGLERLRARYAELLARINDRVADPGQREALREQAGALDPDRWVTMEDARAGLESYEARYHELKGRVGGGRRRRRRRKRPRV